MALKANSMTVAYVAWDTSANAGKTGDNANHTLRWIKDGTSSATTNSPTEVDATNCPGVYKVTLTATETSCTYGILAGVSSTSNVSIMPVSIAFEDIDTITTKTSLIGTSITINTPVNASTSQVTLIQGDDYGTATGNALTWSSTDWTDLTNFTAKFHATKLRGGTDGNLSDVAVTITNAGEATQNLSVTLTDTQTDALGVGTDIYLYQIKATKDSSAEEVTLARGYITVLDKVA